MCSEKQNNRGAKLITWSRKATLRRVYLNCDMKEEEGPLVRACIRTRVLQRSRGPEAGMCCSVCPEHGQQEREV